MSKFFLSLLFFLLISNNAYSVEWFYNGTAYSSLSACMDTGNQNHVVVINRVSESAGGTTVRASVYSSPVEGQQNYPGTRSCVYLRGSPCDPAGGEQNFTNGEDDDPAEIPDSLCRDECGYSRTPGDVGSSDPDGWSAGYTSNGNACSGDELPEVDPCVADSESQQCTDNCAAEWGPSCPASSSSSGGSSSGGSASGSGSGGSASGSGSGGSASGSGGATGSSGSGGSGSGGSGSGGSSSGGSSGGACDAENIEACLDNAVTDIAEFCLQHPDAPMCKGPDDSTLPDHTNSGYQNLDDVFSNFYTGLNNVQVIQAFNGVANVVSSGGDCPILSFDLSATLIGRVISTDLHCQIAESLRAALYAIMLVVYAIIGFKIIASA